MPGKMYSHEERPSKLKTEGRGTITQNDYVKGNVYASLTDPQKGPGPTQCSSQQGG